MDSHRSLQNWDTAMQTKHFFCHSRHHLFLCGFLQNIYSSNILKYKIYPKRAMCKRAKRNFFWNYGQLQRYVKAVNIANAIPSLWNTWYRVHPNLITKKILLPALSGEAFCNSATHICWKSDFFFPQSSTNLHFMTTATFYMILCEIM